MEKARKIAVWTGGLFDKILKQGKSIQYGEWLFFLLAMIVLRTFIINLEQGLPDKTTTFLVAFFLQDFFFFWAVLVLVWLWLSFWLRIKITELSGIIYWGTWLVILPLLIDLIWAGKIYWSFYLLSSPQELFKQYISFFGNLPPAVVYFGTRISAGLAVIVTSAFVFWHSRSFWRTAVNALFVYSVFFLATSLPSWVVFLREVLRGNDFLSITSADVAGTILSPARVWGIDYRLLSSAISFKLNLVETLLLAMIAIFFLILKDGKASILGSVKERFTTHFIVVICLASGLLFGLAFNPESATIDFFNSIALGAAIVAALAGSELMTRMGNSRNPLGLSYNSISEKSLILGILSSFGLLALGIKFFLFGLGWMALKLILQSGRLGLGRAPFFPKIIETIPFLAVMNLGFILSNPEQSLVHFPWQSGIWLAAGLVLFPLFRKESGGPEFISPSWMRIVYGSAYFVFFTLAPYIFVNPDLFGWSLLAGAASFWILERPYFRQKLWLNMIFGLFLILVFFGS